MVSSGSRGWFCYLLACADGTLYAGITTALERRLVAHNAGAASKYTRARRPVRLVWAEMCTDRSAASRREAVIKALPRALKLALADAPSPTPPPAREAAGASIRPGSRRPSDSAGVAAGAGGTPRRRAAAPAAARAPAPSSAR